MKRKRTTSSACVPHLTYLSSPYCAVYSMFPLAPTWQSWWPVWPCRCLAPHVQLWGLGSTRHDCARVKDRHKELEVSSGGTLRFSSDRDRRNCVCILVLPQVRVRRVERKKSGVAATQHENRCKLVHLPISAVVMGRNRI